MESFHRPLDASTPVPTGADPFGPWLTVSEAVAYCQTSGLSRTPKTVRKWAQLAHQTGDQGDVTVRHQDTENGFRWLIERTSLDVEIAQEKDYEARKAETSPDDADSEPVRTGPHMLLPVRTDERGSARNDHSAEMIDFLKKQIDEKDRQLHTKDDQIAAMLERDRETNFLIRGLQSMLTLRAPRERHIDPEGDNSTQYDH